MTAPDANRTLDGVLRTNFLFFIEKCFYELNGATSYLRNWHIEAIAHELERCRTGANRPLINHSAAALAEIALRIGGIPRIPAGA